jgi:hypothetical protein
MSKKDYQAIAAALWRVQPEPAGGNDPDRRAIEAVRRTWYSAVEAVAGVMAASNPRFDRGRFIEACETGTCRGMRKVA